MHAPWCRSYPEIEKLHPLYAVNGGPEHDLMERLLSERDFRPHWETIDQSHKAQKGNSLIYADSTYDALYMALDHACSAIPEWMKLQQKVRSNHIHRLDDNLQELKRNLEILGIKIPWRTLTHELRSPTKRLSPDPDFNDEVRFYLSFITSEFVEDAQDPEQRRRAEQFEAKYGKPNVTLLRSIIHTIDSQCPPLYFSSVCISDIFIPWLQDRLTTISSYGETCSKPKASDPERDEFIFRLADRFEMLFGQKRWEQVKFISSIAFNDPTILTSKKIATEAYGRMLNARINR